MKKLLTGVITLVALLMILAGCGSSQNNETASDDGKTTIKMLVPGYDTGYLKEALDSAVKSYEEANDDIKIKIVSVGWDDLNSDIVKLYQSGDSPDILMMGSRSIRQFAEQGVLEDLDSYMSQSFLDNRIENVMETGQYDGKQYGIPLALSSRVLYYRSDLIDQAPTNWDELLATAKSVSAENDMYGFAIPTDITSGTDEILNFIYQGDGQIVNDQGDFVIDSKQNIDTLNYLQEFKDVIPDPVSTARTDQVEMFKNGDLAMFVSGGWDQEEMDKSAEGTPYAVAELPAGAKKAVTLVTDSYGLSAASKHKKAAFKFIEFLGEEKQQRAVSESYNWLPVTKAEESDERFQTDFMKPFVSILADGQAEPQVPNWDTFNKSFTIAVQQTLTGEKTAEEALKTAQQEVTE